MSLLTLLSLGLCAAAAPLERRQSPAIPSNVPSFVTEYAPIVYLSINDKYLPSDIGAQLANTKPEINSTVIADAPNPLTLDNLNALNNAAGANGGKSVFLTSNIPAYDNPAYLYGVKPDSAGKTEGAVSAAIVVNDHKDGSGIVDAFYFYFYAFNFGGEYYGLIVDDHVGDWEHNMIRFVNGTPSQVYYSQHSSGEAFTYQATNKYNDTVRPLAYSGNGTHANYASPGDHDHTFPGVDLPLGPIEDHTDAGVMWDPTLSAYYATYCNKTNTFAAYEDSTPVNWLYYTGAWGDAKLADSNTEQDCPFNISALCKYTGGPTGPEDKDLSRTNVCPDSEKNCDVKKVVLLGE